MSSKNELAINLWMVNSLMGYMYIGYYSGTPVIRTPWVSLCVLIIGVSLFQGLCTLD